ncbi:transmembrane amino acid transporter protein-domain-containing protein [Scheffersomyces coipomensis]|uniref:transmembrane amino acid transporter protein-domain-containing protein n=1 Tax=Scheffersomyces coipomensis TaxID=1788519 RepID=UPI00315CEE89
MSSFRQTKNDHHSLSNSPFHASPPTSVTSNSSNFLNPNQRQHSSTFLNRYENSSYSEQIQNVSSSKGEFDYKTINKHLVPSEDMLKSQGGDIARQLYHQLEEENNNNSTINSNIVNNTISTNVKFESSSPLAQPKRRTRSSSFSTYLTETRRESTASDINVPGGFRREFLINKSLKNNEEPPNFLTRNFIEFLSIYGHFAGEDFSDDDDNISPNDAQSFEDVFDEEASLLTRSNNAPKGTASVPKAFFLVFKSLVGSGVLFLPRAFFNGGLSFSIFALTGFGILTYFCYIVLLESRKVLNLTSFGELGYKTYGTPLKISIMVSIILSQIGFVGGYILFTAENMLSFIDTIYPGDTPSFITTGNIVVVQCVLLIPLVLIRNLTKLSLISLVSSLFIIIGLVIIFWFAGLNLVANGLGPNITHFNPKSWSMLIGVAVTSFEGIGLILPIEQSMAQPEKFPMVLSISMFFITALFVGIGTIGYSSYGDQVKSIIILNLPQGNLAVQSILILYSLAVFLTAPLQLFPAIKIGESLIFSGNKRSKADSGKLYHNSGKYNPQVKWLKNLFRAVSTTAICTIAYLNAANIDKFVSFNGCFACIPLVYIYPPLIHLKTLTIKNQLTTLEKFFRVSDYILIVVGIVAVIYTTYQIVFLN